MKKTYQNPTVKVVKLQTTQIMTAVSGFNQALETNGTSGDKALGRDNDSFWDDEE